MPKDYVINYFSRNAEKIEECLATMQAGAEPDVYINAYCYLTYRALEDKFKDRALLFSKFKETEAQLCLIEDAHTKARWESSLITAYCYLYIKERGADDELVAIAQKGIREDLVQNWPRIMVNPIMLGLICMAYYIHTNQYSAANEQLTKIFKIYQEAVYNSKICSEHMSHYVIYEFKEAVMLLNACILLGKASGFNMNYTEVSDINKEIRNSLRTASSTSTYYEVFCKTAPEFACSEK